MKQKGFAPVLIILVIAVLGVALYSGYKNWPIVQNLISPTLNVDISKWKTYTNSEAGYSIKYPPDWSASENTISNVKSPLPKRGVITIAFYPTDTSIVNLDALLSSILKNFKSSGGDPPFTKYESKSNTKVAGYSALKIVGSGYGGKFINYLVVNPIAKTNAHISVVYQEGDLEKIKSTVDQILSTFKFLGQDKTANWKTYTDSKFGYSLMYPADWKVDTTSEDTVGICSKPAESNSCLTIHDSPYKAEVFLSNLSANKQTAVLESIQDVHLKYVDAKSFKISTTAGPYEYKIQYYHVESKTGLKIILSFYSGSENDAIFNQIISTFKFTN